MPSRSRRRDGTAARSSSSTTVFVQRPLAFARSNCLASCSAGSSGFAELIANLLLVNNLRGQVDAWHRLEEPMPSDLASAALASLAGNPPLEGISPCKKLCQSRTAAVEHGGYLNAAGIGGRSHASAMPVRRFARTSLRLVPAAPHLPIRSSQPS